MDSRPIWSKTTVVAAQSRSVVNGGRRDECVGEEGGTISDSLKHSEISPPARPTEFPFQPPSCSCCGLCSEPSLRSHFHPRWSAVTI